MKNAWIVCLLMLCACGNDDDKKTPDIPVVVNQSEQPAGDTSPRSYAENALLKGHVKSVRITTYDPVYAKEKLQGTKISWASDANMFITLNEAGYVVTNELYNGDLELKMTERAFYNELGYPMGTKAYSKDEILETVTEFIYDSNGFLVRMDLKDTTQRIGMTGTFVNDINGFPKIAVMKRGNGSIMRESEFVYDAKGLVLTTTNFNTTNMVTSKEENKYDENDNLIETVITNMDPPSTEIKTYIYEFDEQGNWTKQTTLDGDGVTLKIIERQIEYFEN